MPATASLQQWLAAAASALRSVDHSGSQASPKNKLILVALETFPLVGWLGFDRIYLGQLGIGLLKMAICICTLFIGGAIWGLMDGYVVIANALAREGSIQRLGMVAKFDAAHLEGARQLAIVTLVCWVAIAICCIRAAGARLRKTRLSAGAEAVQPGTAA
jgi:TM2 domain-containing membrane protein YozV